MKLRKLTVHNIASIEDAEIDFQAAPLADADVFLISGKTGAGKSTILDCICLALFTSTPRMDLTMMEGKMNDNADKINVDNPRQLLRRGTGEGFSRLLFTGNDGVDYEATWTVSRAHNRPTGRLQKALNWEIRNLTTGTITKSSEENKAIIRRALGVDFNQFCRTTLLAQGEFTRFLNSKDSEKAQILEKITGASHYALIGAKVFEIYSGKKKGVDSARQKIADIKILTATEIESLNSQLNDITSRKKQLGVSIAKLRKSAEWLASRSATEEKIKSVESEVAKARAVLDSPEMTAIRLTLSQWNETSDVRPVLAVLEQSCKELSDIERESGSFAPRFASIVAARDSIEAAISAGKEKLNRVNRLIADESINKSVYASAELIAALIEQIDRQLDIRRSHEKKAEDIAEEITRKLQPTFDRVSKDCIVMAENLNLELKRLSDGEAALEALQITNLKNEHDRLTQRRNDLTGALKSLLTWISEHDRLEALKADILRRGKLISEKQKKYSDSLAELDRLKCRRDSLKTVYDNQKNTVDKWAVAMRSHLHAGDQCPVCMQVISDVPEQQVINQLLAEAETAFLTADRQYENFVTERNRLGAEINVEMENLERNRKAVADTALLNRSALEVTSLVKTAVGSETPVSLSADFENKLRSMLADNEKQLSEHGIRLKEANASEEAVAAQRKKVDSLRSDLDRKHQHLESLRAGLDKAKSLHEKSVALARTSTDNIVSVQARLSTLLKGSAYESLATNLAILNKQIISSAAKYNSAVEQSGQIASELSDCDKTLSNIKSGIEALVGLYPPFRDVDPSSVSAATSPATKPEEAITRLHSHIQSSSDRRSLAQNRRNESEATLRAFFDSTPGIDLNRLKELSAISLMGIKEMSDRANRAAERLTESETILRQFRKQLDELMARKPDGIEETTIEILGENIKASEIQVQQLDETTGSIRQQLSDNESNMTLRAKQIEAISRLLNDLSPWENLNSLIGDATGAKFRKIAQSFVLAALVNSANHYMASLSDRYRLKVEPGTFIISIEDAYQGYICRPCTTISGGESFLVSLALALSLSDIGDRIASDTIFIDEGFGSLSTGYLRKAIDTLRSLHSKVGRHVGIISHVDELREQIPVQINVNRDSHNSAATVEIIG